MTRTEAVIVEVIARHGDVLELTSAAVLAEMVTEIAQYIEMQRAPAQTETIEAACRFIKRTLKNPELADELFARRAEALKA